MNTGGVWCCFDTGFNLPLALTNLTYQAKIILAISGADGVLPSCWGGGWHIVPILMSEYDFPKNRKSSVLLLQCIVVVLIRSTNDRLRCFMDLYAKINAGCATKILFSGGLKGIVCPTLPP